MPVMVAARLVYCTCPDLETARRLARTVVEAGWAACANILPGMLSCYRWQGAIEEASEVVLLLKTTAERSAALVDHVVALHPYDVPCVVVLPIEGGNPAYLEWLVAQP